jgi:hypothetical protein
VDGLDKGESESTITTQTLIAQLGNGLVKREFSREFSASKAEPETSNSPHTKESSEQVQQEVL